MKNPSLYIFLFFLSYQTAVAQNLKPNEVKILQLKEDSLKMLAKNLIVDSVLADRMRSDSLFVRTLIRTLQVKNSFYYPFDSVQGISKLYSPDSTFRIFTWAISYDDYYSRQRGAIQMKTPDGKLKLIPLRDFSEFTPNPTDSVRTKDNWIGAVYYNIIKTTFNGKNFYTLFGFDANGVRSNKKWIEVLTFDAAGMPVFGGPYFIFPKTSGKPTTQNRFTIEYKKEASTLVNYEKDLDLILVDHLISESDEPDQPYTFIPDGDYEGFAWKAGKWVFVDKVFNQKLEDGQAPMPSPIMDAAGNRNEDQLFQQSEKNRNRKKNE